MAFLEEHPDYKEYDQSKGYLYYDVPYSAWSYFESLIEEAGGDNKECLFNILSKIAIKVRAGHVDSLFLNQQIPDVVSKIRSSVKAGKFHLFMDCLAILHDEGELGLDAINEFLDDCNLGYVAEKDVWTHKLGWRLRDKEVVNNENESVSINSNMIDRGEITMNDKNNLNHIIFITHSSKDKKYVLYLTELLRSMKIPNTCIICSSDPRHKIPNGESTYAWLKKQFTSSTIHMIFVLSENYYKSVPCLNEMGAAWLVANRSDLLLLPGFEFEDFKKKNGCLDKDIQGVSVDSGEVELKAWLNNLRDDIVEEFSVERPNDLDWEDNRDKFIKNISCANTNQSVPDNNLGVNANAVIGMEDVGFITVETAFLLVYAANSDGVIRLIKIDNAPTVVSTGRSTFMTEKSQRESARWNEALDRLRLWGWVKDTSGNGVYFELTDTGYRKADWLKENMQINTDIDPMEEIKSFE